MVLLLLWKRVPESRGPAAGSRIDWIGASLVTTGLGGLVYGLIEAPVAGWANPVVVAALAIGGSALAAFVFAEAHVQAPMMPQALFKSRVFSGANVLTLLLYAALGGALFFLPFNLVQVQGYSATAAGAALLPLVASAFNRSLDARLAQLPLPAEMRSAVDRGRDQLAGMEAPDGPAEVTRAVDRAIKHAFVTGFRLVMLISAALAVLSAVSAACMISGAPAPATVRPV